MSKLQMLAEKYILLRDKLAETKSEQTEAQKNFDELRKHELPELMEDLDIESVRLKGIGTVSLATDAYTSLKKENKAAGFAWLTKHGFGDIIKDDVNSSTMKALLKDLSRQGIDFPTDIFKFTPFTYAKITKS